MVDIFDCCAPESSQQITLAINMDQAASMTVYTAVHETFKWKKINFRKLLGRITLSRVLTKILLHS